MKRIPDEIDPMMAMGLQLLLGAVPLALWSAWTEDFSLTNWSGQFFAVLIALAVLGTSLPFWLWFVAIKEVDLNRANVFRFLVPLFGLAIGAAFFDERLGWVQAVSTALILGGIALVQSDAGGKAA
jgi:drug/metabolite transporter (DMT)-like permease